MKSKELFIKNNGELQIVMIRLSKALKNTTIAASIAIKNAEHNLSNAKFKITQ